MRGCAELRRVRRGLRLQRLLPGLACIGGLFAVSVPLSAPTYGIDEEWADWSAELIETAPEAAAEDAA